MPPLYNVAVNGHAYQLYRDLCIFGKTPDLKPQIGRIRKYP